MKFPRTLGPTAALILIGALGVANAFGVAAAQAPEPNAESALAPQSDAVAPSTSGPQAPSELVARSRVDAEGSIPDIRDIHGPIAPPVATPWRLYALAGALALALLTVLWLGVIAVRRRRRLPHRRALAALDALSERVEELDQGGLSDALADLLRVYVRDRFAVAAPQRTIEELVAELAHHPALSAHAPRLVDILGRCDRVRFACEGADDDARRALIASARAFVEESAAERTATKLGDPPRKRVSSNVAAGGAR